MCGGGVTLCTLRAVSVHTEACGGVRSVRSVVVREPGWQSVSVCTSGGGAKG